MMRILIAGDYYPNRRITVKLDSGQKDIISNDIVELIQYADLSIVNYESPMTEGVDCSPIAKSGPSLHSNKNAIDYIKALGFSLATLANNHTSDYGQAGLLNTISYLKEKGIATIGAGKDLNEASSIYYKDEVAIINCCEHEFGIAEIDKAGANPLNAVQQYYKIKEARTHAKYIIVIVHGGCENFQYPTPRMKELYRFFIDAGADAVINAHQHCYSGYELFHDKPIFYGLGNFCFDSFSPKDKPSPWNYGYMVELKLNNTVEFEIYPYSQCAEDPIVKLLQETDKQEFINNIDYLNSIISDNQKLTRTYKEWDAKNNDVYQYIMRPFHTRKGFFPWLKGILFFHRNKSMKELVLNCIRCESHRERLIRSMESKI